MDILRLLKFRLVVGSVGLSALATDLLLSHRLVLLLKLEVDLFEPAAHIPSLPIDLFQEAELFLIHFIGVFLLLYHFIHECPLPFQNGSFLAELLADSQ